MGMVVMTSLMGGRSLGVHVGTQGWDQNLVRNRGVWRVVESWLLDHRHQHDLWEISNEVLSTVDNGPLVNMNTCSLSVCILQAIGTLHYQDIF